jgi:hypothetical protein
VLLTGLEPADLKFKSKLRSQNGERHGYAQKSVNSDSRACAWRSQLRFF